MPFSPFTPDTPMPAGFFAGTLVHTDRGLRWIGDLAVGDLVVSPPTSGDDNILRPVSSIATIEDVPFVVARFSCRTGSERQSESIIVAGLPHLFVSGIDPDYPDELRDEVQHLLGWQEIRQVQSMLRVKSLTDPLASMRSVSQVWKGLTASLGWTELSHDSESGFTIEFDGDRGFEERLEKNINGLAEGSDYLERHESSDIANEVAMKSTVHAIELDEGLPFFVGAHGICVQPGRTPNAFTAWAHERIWE
jgi:hypothetical protein